MLSCNSFKPLWSCWVILVFIIRVLLNTILTLQWIHSVLPQVILECWIQQKKLCLKWELLCCIMQNLSLYLKNWSAFHSNLEKLNTVVPGLLKWEAELHFLLSSISLLNFYLCLLLIDIVNFLCLFTVPLSIF